MHENLQVSINLTEIGSAIKTNSIKPYVGKDGSQYVTLDVLVNRNGDDQYGNSHYVVISQKGDDGRWSKVMKADKVAYFGNAKPSKFQPDGASTTQDSTNTTAKVSAPPIDADEKSSNDLPF